MLDVHPPHESTHSWKDFFIHVATICIGLLIAIGLEQTVEYIHHQRQVAETREALAIERKINILRFAAQTAEFRRFAPVLQTDLAIFLYLQKHPGAPPEQWPGKLSVYFSDTVYNDSAWSTAGQNNILALMPPEEVRKDADLYLRLRLLNQYEEQRVARSFSRLEYRMDGVDEAHMSPQQIAHEIDYLHRQLQLYTLTAFTQHNLTLAYPDFAPAPSLNEFHQVIHSGEDDPNQMAVTLARDNLAKAIASADPNDTTSSR